MSQTAHPILSVLVRRFRREYAGDIDKAIEDIQKAVADQPGFIGLQNGIIPKRDGCELVTVFTFDTQENLERWQNSRVRESYTKELDQLSQGAATNTQFGNLAILVAPTARISKLETVIILIAWILLLGQVLGPAVGLLLRESVGPFWQNALMTTIIVVLISNVFLPASSLLLTRLKTRLLAPHRR